jgi:hypothetical protein
LNSSSVRGTKKVLAPKHPPKVTSLDDGDEVMPFDADDDDEFF